MAQGRLCQKRVMVTVTAWAAGRRIEGKKCYRATPTQDPGRNHLWSWTLKPSHCLDLYPCAGVALHGRHGKPNAIASPISSNAGRKIHLPRGSCSVPEHRPRPVVGPALQQQDNEG